MENRGGNIIVNHSCQSSLSNKWTVTGKVSDVTRTGGSSKPDLHFDYDAMGQRIAKTVTNKNTTDGTDKFVTTYYVRDPQGNVLAVYEHKRGDSGNGTFTLAEQHLYGAGRLGMRKRDLALNVANASESTPTVTHYELTNHLGNVMAVISDKASTTAEPTVVSLSDYYPFGMTEPGRSWNSSDYRFGYTGHEKENDLAEGVYTTEYRLLDTRLGRWLSVDKLWTDYPELGSYVYCAGNPMVFWDPDGKAITIVYNVGDKGVAPWLNKGCSSVEGSLGRVKSNTYGERLYKYIDLKGQRDLMIVGISPGMWKTTHPGQSMASGGGQHINAEGKIYLSYEFQGDTYAKNTRWTDGTLFEEMFHAGQHRYYTDCSNHWQMEVEVKVARAMFGFYSKERGGDKYIREFAESNREIIKKILDRKSLSKEEQEKWNASLRDFEKKVFEIYDGYEEESSPTYYRRLNFLTEIIKNTLDKIKAVTIYKEEKVNDDKKDNKK